MLFALACGALALTMQPTAVGSLRTATPPCTAARGVIVRMEESKSTPETIAANKAKYEANKAARAARKAPTVGEPGAVGATKKRKNSKFDKGKRIQN